MLASKLRPVSGVSAAAASAVLPSLRAAVPAASARFMSHNSLYHERHVEPANTPDSGRYGKFGNLVLKERGQDTTSGQRQHADDMADRSSCLGIFQLTACLLYMCGSLLCSS